MVVLPQDIDVVEAALALEPAFDRSEVHFALDWAIRCQKDLAQLWRSGDLWAVTEVIKTKQGRAIHIVAIAGTFDPEFVREIEQWGRTVGCTRAYFTGRKGWLRKMRDYRLRTVTMSKEL